MTFKGWVIRIAGVAAIVLGLALAARADEEPVGAVAPPPVKPEPTAKPFPPPKPTYFGPSDRLEVDPRPIEAPPELTPATYVGAALPSAQTPAKNPPAQAELAPPPAAKTADPVATVHIAVPAAAPAPPPQTITLQVVTTSAPAAASALPPVAPLLAELRHPGPVRNAIGNFGEWLALAKRDRLVVHSAAPSTTPVVLQLVQQPPAVAAPPAQAILATPQAPLKSFGSYLFPRR